MHVTGYSLRVHYYDMIQLCHNNNYNNTLLALHITHYTIDYFATVIHFLSAFHSIASCTNMSLDEGGSGRIKTCTQQSYNSYALCNNYHY